MLHVSKLIDNVKEIKSQIGSKTHDVKVIEYYKILSGGIDLYPKTETINNIISFEIDYWELLLEKRALFEVDKKRFKKLGLSVDIDVTALFDLISDIILLTDNPKEGEQSAKEIETLSFSRALFFYVSNLWFIKGHKNTYAWTHNDFKREIKTMSENLNFIKDYIKEIGRLDFDEMCRRYSKVVGNVKKAEYVQQEIEEYSKILNTHISSKGWKYLDENFVWSIIGLRPDGFDIDDISSIHDMLTEGNFYSVIYKYEIGINLITLLLTTEMYVEFLQSQISNTKPLENKYTTVDVSEKGEARQSKQSFFINPERYENYEKKIKWQIENYIASHLEDMMKSLISKRYIHSETKKNNFLEIFSGNEVKKKTNWIGTQNQLHYFIETLYNEKLEPVKGKEIWIITSKCFKMAGIVDEKKFSRSIGQAKAITKPDIDQLNTCINHLSCIK